MHLCMINDDVIVRNGKYQTRQELIGVFLDVITFGHAEFDFV